IRSSADARDAIDLDFPAAAEDGLHGGARRIVSFEELAIDLIHSVKIVEIGDVDRNLDHVVQAASGRLEDLRNIGKFQSSLRADIAQLQFLACRIDRRLAGYKYEAAGDYGVRIRAKRFWELRRGNHSFCGAALLASNRLSKGCRQGGQKHDASLHIDHPAFRSWRTRRATVSTSPGSSIHTPNSRPSPVFGRTSIDGSPSRSLRVASDTVNGIALCCHRMRTCGRR